MANDETPKIEPTLVLRDAPSIAADDPKPGAVSEPGEVAVFEAPKAETTAPDAAKAVAPKAPKRERPRSRHPISRHPRSRRRPCRARRS